MPATKELFKEHINPVFIETGSCVGDGISHALSAGFKKIYSIEAAKVYYEVCCGIFGNMSTVSLLHGRSPEVLDSILPSVTTPITFWLDAHYSGDRSFGELEKCPLMDELDSIKKHNIKTHTILIDDLREWTVEKNGFDIEDIKTSILSINKDYVFRLADGICPNDILIATVE